MATQRILLVSSATPFSPRSGGQQRSALLYEALKRHGEVDVLLLEPTPGATRLAPPPPGVRAHGYWRQGAFGIGKYDPDPTLHRLLQEAGVDLGAYDVVVSRYLNPITKLALPSGVRTVVDLDDWGYHYTPTSLAITARLKTHYAAWLARRQLPRFDAYFFVSRQDRARHRALRATVLPNIPFDPPAVPLAQNVTSKTLLFVGALWYLPNRNGIERFLERCWPQIRAADPTACVLLVGAAPAAVRARWEAYGGVTAPGFVEDLDAAYADAAFTIAPIDSGGGTNIKVLESLAYGRACVTTSHCARVLEEALAPGLDLADDDATYVARCLTLLAHPALRAARVEASGPALRAHYSRDAFQRQVDLLLAPPQVDALPAPPLPQPIS